MEGLSIEQKAKRYDEAFERVKELLSRCMDNGDRRTKVYRVEDIESIFPELKKNEDEKIKEDLIQWISDFPDMIWSGHYREDVIKWLKKQGEQKQDVSIQISPSEYVNDMGGDGCYLKNATQTSTCSKKEEKVDNQKCVKPVYNDEPKFKAGDWIVFTNGNVERIISVGTHGYTFDDGDYLLHDKCDKIAHLWTIQDAKDGDVLASKDGNDILIFRNLDNNTSFSFYYNIRGRIEIGWSNRNFIPATKEQRDALMKALDDKGYTFDFEKKELREIEQKLEEKHSTLSLKDFQEAFELKARQYDIELPNRGYDIHAMCKELYSLLIKQNPAWSKKDEKMFEYALNMIEWYGGKNEDKSRFVSDWLKSIKQRIGR